MHFPKRLTALISWPTRRRRPGPNGVAAYPLVGFDKLRFADTDCNGHISHAVFAECCQSARMELLHDGQRLSVPSAAQFVIGRLDLQFLAEMHWPGTVCIGTRVTRIGRCSVVLAQALFLDDRRAAVARSTVVLIDTLTRLPRPLPPDLIDGLKGFRGSSANVLGLVQRVAAVLYPHSGEL